MGNQICVPDNSTATAAQRLSIERVHQNAGPILTHDGIVVPYLKFTSIGFVPTFPDSLAGHIDRSEYAGVLDAVNACVMPLASTFESRELEMLRDGVSSGAMEREVAASTLSGVTPRMTPAWTKVRAYLDEVNETYARRGVLFHGVRWSLELNPSTIASYSVPVLVLAVPFLHL